ncbi:MAG: DEAD/DEAH box helicase [Chitinophagaceae bacterium]
MGYIKKRVIPVNLPIEFKEINPEDFPGFVIEGNAKTIISPDEEGFIGTKLRNVINLLDKNTVVLNAGVGQGKSTACIDIAKAYYSQYNSRNEHEYTVIVVAPYISIINQYHEKLIDKGITPTDVFNFVNLEETDLEASTKAPIHILTIHTLLGYYGEEAFMQNKTKRDYLTSTITYCSKKRKKVVFVFDEVHDYVNVFKERLVFNLWKWQPLLHKSFLLTATFTEASKLVIKYLAELTDDKIQLIETKRIKIPNKQSKLHLFIHDESWYKAEDKIIAELIQQEIDKGKHIQILSFSKTLANSIVAKEEIEGEVFCSQIGSVLYKKYSEINLCNGESGNSFKERMCNVGTTFKTGISIESDDVSFFIIAPHKAAYQDNDFGIFTGGINSVIQALARIRSGNNTDIFIIMPPPNILIKNPSNITSYFPKLKKVTTLSGLVKYKRTIDYCPLGRQTRIIAAYYKKLKEYSSQGIQNIERKFGSQLEARGQEKPFLRFPSLDEVMLEVGDKYLSTCHPNFGSNISAYILWAACNNQFQNCELHSIFYKERDELMKGELTQGLLNLLVYKIGVPENLDYLPEKRFYELFYTKLTTEYKVEIIKADGTREKARNSSSLKIQLMNVIQLFKRHNEQFTTLVYPNGTFDEDGIVIRALDTHYLKDNYIRCAIANSIHYLADYQKQLIGGEKKALQGYRNLYALFQNLKDVLIFRDVRGQMYILKAEVYSQQNLIQNNLRDKLLKTIKSIREGDSLVKDDTISFCQWAKKVNLSEVQSVIADDKLIEKVLNEVRKIFTESKDTTISPNKILINSAGYQISGIEDAYRIISEVDFQKYQNYINLVYTTNCPDLESIVSEKYIQEQIEYHKNTVPEAIF